MTSKEAWEKLAGEVPATDNEIEDAIEMGMDALERDIPKLVKHYDEKPRVCPHCNELLFDLIIGTESVRKPDYCSFCGQRLEWNYAV